MTDQELERRLAELPKALAGWHFGPEQQAAVRARLAGSPRRRWVSYATAVGGAAAVLLLAVLIWPGRQPARQGGLATGPAEAPAEISLTGLPEPATEGRAEPRVATEPPTPSPTPAEGAEGPPAATEMTVAVAEPTVVNPDGPVSSGPVAEPYGGDGVVDLPEPRFTVQGQGQGVGVAGYTASDAAKQHLFRGGPLFVLPGYEAVAVEFSPTGELAVIVGQQGEAYAYWVVNEPGEVLTFAKLDAFVTVEWSGATELLFNDTLRVELP